MATTAAAHKSSSKMSPLKNGRALFWLDDNSDQQNQMKSFFLKLFERFIPFNDPNECIELVESADSEKHRIYMLVSGKYGQMLVPTRFQQAHQVENIYVYCMDTNRHNQWAQKCDKVRIVESDFNKIMSCIESDMVNKTTIPKEPTKSETVEKEELDQMDVDEILPEELDRFTDGNNFYDQLALQLITKCEHLRDGEDDFVSFCEKQGEKKGKQEIQQFDPNARVKDWFKRDLSYLELNSTNLQQLFQLRWFLQIFHEQLSKEKELICKAKSRFPCFYVTWLRPRELDGMKRNIGEHVIFTELIEAYLSEKAAVQFLSNVPKDPTKHKVLFEISVDTKIDQTVPYGELSGEIILFWLGSKHRITKVEYIEDVDERKTYWLIGMSLCRNLDKNKSFEKLMDYYVKTLLDLDDFQQAFGRILMYKGLYNEAYKWFEITKNYEELTEIAIRQNQYEKVKVYLEKLPKDSSYGNLLRAYACLLPSEYNPTRARGIVTRICSKEDDPVIKALANIVLGFVTIALTDQTDDPLDYFQTANALLLKSLPDLHPIIAKSLIGLGYAHYALKSKESDPKQCFQKAYAIQRLLLPSNHSDFAKTRSALAHCSSLNKHTMKDGLSDLQYAYNLLMQEFRHYKKHPELEATKNDIDQIRKGKELPVRDNILDYI